MAEGITADIRSEAFLRRNLDLSFEGITFNFKKSDFDK